MCPLLLNAPFRWGGGVGIEGSGGDEEKRSGEGENMRRDS